MKLASWHKTGLSPFGVLIVMVAPFLAVAPIPASASLLSHLSGSAQLSALSSTSGTGDTRSLSQDYNLNWSRRMSSHWQARAALRYYDLGLDPGQGINIWQRDLQPIGELSWIHPFFSLTGISSYQKLWSNNSVTDLINKTHSVSFLTKVTSYPTVRFRYDRTRSYNATDRKDRDSRGQRWQGIISHSLGRQELYYSFSRRVDDNLVNDLRIAENQHVARWNQTLLMKQKRLRLSSSYNFTYRTQTMTRAEADSVLRPIPFIDALAAYDPTPDLGGLDTLRALGDGNITEPVRPPIDIGQALLDRNLGIDFGFPRTIDAVYIYTDRPSGFQVTWRVYISSDNETWTPVAGSVSAAYNNSYNRYEIIFPRQLTRYIKAVNGGVNDVPTVLITEMEPWEYFPEAKLEKYSQYSHLITLSGAYKISTTLQSEADISLAPEPGGDFTTSRDQFYYTLSMRHTPSSIVTQSLRYAAGQEKFKVTRTRNSSDNLTYALKLTPLPTLEFSVAALTRLAYINRVKSQETNSLSFRCRAQLLDALTVAGMSSYSRANIYESRHRFDTWTYQLSGRGTLIAPLDIGAEFTHQATSSPSLADKRTRRQYSADLNYRVTGSIMAGAIFGVNEELQDTFTSQEYSLAWNLGSKFSTGGTLTINSADRGGSSRRGAARFTYLISPQTALFFTYAGNEFREAGRGRIDSYQIGFKTGF